MGSEVPKKVGGGASRKLEKKTPQKNMVSLLLWRTYFGKLLIIIDKSIILSFISFFIFMCLFN